MTLEEAIEILKSFIIQDPDPDFQDIADSIKLGIEALKRIQFYNRELKVLDPPLLPGETKE